MNPVNAPGMRQTSNPSFPRGFKSVSDDMRQMFPNQSNFPNMMQFQNFNTLMNQSNQNNDFARMGVPTKDLDTSNLSNRDSVNQSLTNISRDSSRANLNSSKRNASSRANVKDKNFQVSINDDISLIERIEVSLNQITMNHNKVCPFCSKSTPKSLLLC